MREHKYRVWDNTEKKMERLHSISYPPSGIEINGSNIVGEKTLLEYTGLSDKNGKEIYEGDIWDFGGWINTVKWNKEKAGFGLWNSERKKWDCETDISALSHNDGRTAFYWGNIYENPDLLEKEGEAKGDDQLCTSFVQKLKPDFVEPVHSPISYEEKLRSLDVDNMIESKTIPIKSALYLHEKLCNSHVITKDKAEEWFEFFKRDCDTPLKSWVRTLNYMGFKLEKRLEKWIETNEFEGLIVEGKK